MKRAMLLAAAVSLTAVAMAGCTTPDESSGVGAINADRVAGNLAPVAQNSGLILKAQNWAKHLAETSGGKCSMETLVHSVLSEGAPGGWRRLGENVGCRIAAGDAASSVGPLQKAFMESPGHRANIMNGEFTHVGVGMASVPAAVGNGWIAVYEAQEFARL
jgi:uncharacterized protein YkwD